MLQQNLYLRPSVSVDGTPITDQRLTVSSTAVQFATAFDKYITQYVVLDIQTNDVMVTFDNSDPTTSNGHLLASGQSYTWTKETAQAAKFIAVGSDGVIHASEFTN